MDRLDSIETHMAHLAKTVDDLNEVVSRQADDIDRLRKTVGMLVDRVRDIEPEGGIILGDERPPHY